MKNLAKSLLVAAIATVFASCQSGTPKGTLDSVAVNSTDSSTSTTVDTLAKTPDTTSTDSTKK